MVEWVARTPFFTPAPPPAPMEYIKKPCAAGRENRKRLWILSGRGGIETRVRFGFSASQRLARAGVRHHGPAAAWLVKFARVRKPSRAAASLPSSRLVGKRSLRNGRPPHPRVSRKHRRGLREEGWTWQPQTLRKPLHSPDPATSRSKSDPPLSLFGPTMRPGRCRKRHLCGGTTAFRRGSRRECDPPVGSAAPCFG